MSTTALRQSDASVTPQLDHLRALEAESIHILREVVAEFERPVMLYSIGKDSSVMLRLAEKAFYPGPIPFPLLHVDTTYKFREMIEFRDQMAKAVGARLIVHTNEEAIGEGTQPFKVGTQRCCGLLKTKALLDGLQAGNFDAALGGARRDEERSRAKERIFSVRDPNGQWDPKRQRSELWNLLNARIRTGESIRVFPLSNWTEIDVWQYIHLENIPIVPLYYAKEREVIVRGNFDREVFDAISDEFEEILGGASFPIPISALQGDNVITVSGRTPWFTGPSLLQYLETVPVQRNLPALPFRFPVQLVSRPNDAFRGYAGQIASGTVRVGDALHVWPSGRSARVTRIVTCDGDLDLAYAPMSVTITLDDEIDISRGDVLTTEPPLVGQRFEAEMVWMDERPLDPARVYLLKQGTRTVTADISHGLVLNQIGSVTVHAARPLVFDRYEANRRTGAFIIIDPATHFTAGAGMITNVVREGAASVAAAPVSAAERIALLARRAGSDADAIDAVRKALEEMLA